MGNIKVKNSSGDWTVVASSKATGISTESTKFAPLGERVSAETVLENHEDRLAKMERNVSWLAKHGGGGSGGGGGTGGGGISEATCTITTTGSDGVEIQTGGTVVVDNTGLVIRFNNISVQATKSWKVSVNIGSINIANGSVSFTNPILLVPIEDISRLLNNHVGNLNIVATYNDDMNGIYGVAQWNGTIVELVVNLNAENVSVGLTDSGDLDDPSAALIYTYSAGLVGGYTLNIRVTKDGKEVTTKSYPINLTDTTLKTHTVEVSELLSKYDVGVYNVYAQFANNLNPQIQSSIINNLTIVSKTIFIATTMLSEDPLSPTEFSLSGSMRLTWTAYLQSSAGFTYNYRVGNSDLFVNDALGYFGVETVDYISVANKPWAVEGETISLIVTVNSGSESASKTFYIRFVRSSDAFLNQSNISRNRMLVNFLARNYNNGDQEFNLYNDEYLYNGNANRSEAVLTVTNVNNLVGIKSSSNKAPYLRLSNGSYARLGQFKTNSSIKTLTSIINSANNNFTISLCFKADYHPNDDRTVLLCGNVDQDTGKILSGFEVGVHDVYVNGQSLLKLTDNTVNNVDITCVRTDEAYIDSEGNNKKSVRYIIKIYLDGTLSAVTDLDTFPTLSEYIYLGNKEYLSNDDSWLCDCDIYSLQVYDYAMSDLDVVTNYINNKIASVYSNNDFDFSIIDAELTKNFCVRDNNNNVECLLYKNNQYDVSFILTGDLLDESKLKSNAKSLGIPVMLIDVSNLSSWTHNAFVTQQTAGNVAEELKNAENVRISYWDPNQQNTSVQVINNATIGLQGTSTLQDAVKNINITVPTLTIFVPKSTWLPEQTYTLKADVVDSSHSNNASIGRFINEVLKDYFPSDENAVENVEQSEYVKNQQPTATLKHTVEGFPILLIMNFYRTEESPVTITPLGIYNFNLGRDAYRNLGFVSLNTVKDDKGAAINVNTFPFLAENCTYTENSSSANWIEIKDTTSVADLIDLDSGSLSANFDSSTGDFWQNDDSILNHRYEVRYPAGSPLVSSYQTFKDFMGIVMALPIEGSHKTMNDQGLIERPEITTEYSLYRYDNGYIKKNSVLQIINDPSNLPDLGFNVTSMYKYFVIANFFGLADNFGKNSTYRSWKNGDYYIGFYDMDTALGGGNQGTLSIEPNMWMKYLKNSIQTGKNFGFVSETFNAEDPERLSNTVFTANYNKLWLSLDNSVLHKKLRIQELVGSSAYSYYWDDFRTYVYNKALEAGYNDVAEYFTKEFYLRQTGECGPMLFNLDYKLKYLVQFTNADSYSNSKYLNKLHGRKAAYTLDWLKKHILFLDSVFYWRNNSLKFLYRNDLNSRMSSTVYNTPASLPIKTNTDLIVYHNVGDRTKTYYYAPKNTTIYVDASQQSSDSELTWGITNSPQIINLGNDDTPLSTMNVYNLSHSFNELPINNPGLSAITELDLADSNSLSGKFNLSSFQLGSAISELRVLNFARTKTRLEAGSRPMFELVLNTTLSDGTTDTKFTKLREIDISNSECISNIKLPSIPLRKLSVVNSAITQLDLINLNFITDVNLAGCTKLITINIQECPLYEGLNVSNLSNLSEVNIIGNASIDEIIINNCNNLRKVTIQNNPNLKTIRITNCAGLVGNSASNYLTITDNASLQTLDLNNCTSLSTFTISKSNQANVSTLNLSNCPINHIEGDNVDTSLLDLHLFTYGSGINVAGNKAVTHIQYANDQNKPILITGSFQGCSNLQRVYGNLTLNPQNGTLGPGMFRNCSKFTVHGDSYKALGPNKWLNKDVFDSGKRVKTVWEILKGKNNPIVDGRRSYNSLTWNNSYQSGSGVTNLKMQTSSGSALNYMFSGTHVTQFDVYYMMFVFATSMNVSFSLTRTFWELVRSGSDYALFRWATSENNMMDRYTFYRCSNCTSISELFTCPNTYMLSPESTYEGEEDNGVLSPLVNLTSISRLTSGTVYYSKDLFKRYSGNYQITSITWWSLIDCYPTDTNYSTYNYFSNNQSSVITQIGNFTGFFDNLPRLSQIHSCFTGMRFNLNTLTFPKSISKIASSFYGTSTGVANIESMFNGCTGLTSIVNSFRHTSNNSAYGTVGEFPITSGMFSSFTNLQQLGFNLSATTEGNYSSYSFQGLRHYINQNTFPYDIFANNRNLNTAAGVFAYCEDKQFSEVPSLPGTMFLNNTKLTNVNSLFRDVDFEFTLSPNSFINCPNLQNVGYMFYHRTSIDSAQRSKLRGEIPYKMFYHGGSTTTKTVYGSNQSTMPDSTFDMDNLGSATVTSESVRATINNMDYCFSGCCNINYYENAAGQSFIENNPDYSPFTWCYDNVGKTWSENQHPKGTIAYWGYVGDPATQLAEHEYLESADIEAITDDAISGKTETLNYMCAPDLLRYCTKTCSVVGLFDYCGMDIQTQGIMGNTENYYSIGITGRIVPYLLKSVSNVSNLSYMFRYCRRLSSYKLDGVIYQIPKSFFDYATSVTSLISTFQGLDFVPGTQLAVFDKLKNRIDIRKIFCLCRYFTSVTGTVQQVNNVFKNNKINYLTGAFAENDITLNGNYYGSERLYWTLDNGSNVTTSGNFTAANLPSSQYLYFVYYLWNSASDAAIPNVQSNYTKA